MERRYHAISQTESDRNKINTNLLSMALNGVVDTPANQGVPMYRKAFFGSDFMALNPEKAPLVRLLQTAIDELVRGFLALPFPPELIVFGLARSSPSRGA